MALPKEAKVGVLPWEKDLCFFPPIAVGYRAGPVFIIEACRQVYLGEDIPYELQVPKLLSLYKLELDPEIEPDPKIVEANEG